jgi:hypothetical protein
MSASPTTFGWVTATQVTTGGYFRFVALVPPTWTDDQAQTYIEGLGWDVKSIGAPPSDVQAALNAAHVVFPGGTIPQAFYVIGTWPGTSGVLPADPNAATGTGVMYEQLSQYVPVPAGTPGDSTSSNPEAPAAPDYSWVPWALGAAALIAGVYVLGRRAETEESTAGHVFGRRRFANPRATPEEAARGMLKRYSSREIALEMAHFHKMDYPQGSPQWTYWDEVYRIMSNRKRNPIQTLNVTVNGRSLPFTIETDGVNWTAFTKIGRKKIVSTGSSKSEALQSAIALASSTLASADVRSSY